GLAIIMSRGLLAMQRNRLVILLGLFNFIVRIACLAVFGILFGPEGVAAAYSIAWVMIALLQAYVLFREGLLDLELPVIRQGLFIGACTAGCAVLLIAGSTLPV